MVKFLSLINCGINEKLGTRAFAEKRINPQGAKTQNLKIKDLGFILLPGSEVEKGEGVVEKVSA